MKAPSPERWQEIKTIIYGLFDLPSEKYTAYLNQRCQDYPFVLQQLKIVLKLNGDSTHLPDPTMGSRLAELINEIQDNQGTPPPSLVGQSIGPYVLVDTLGHGGMGDVYLAERADGTCKQQVALKLIRRGMDSKAVARRFVAERQILARLRHENIARLLDGGMSDAGQPYFVMEHIEGLRITKYCDTNRLGIEARLRLFMQVCRAVQYAHRNLVVHRDLKPSNILVTGEGKVKLLDFGIAKVLTEDGEIMGETVLTHTGQGLMTPEYASPEQIRREAVTTVADVYTLGVMLYELLTGHRPYQLESHNPAELERVICKIDPPRLSAMVSQTMERSHHDRIVETTTPESVSKLRSLSVDKLRQRLSGDLDTMVLKALRKEPERRYASAEAFRADIQRHLSGLPVKAQADTAGYRMRKYIRRHRVGVSVSSLLVLLLAAVIVLLVQRVWQADQIRQEARKLETVQEFLVGLFEVSDPNNVESKEITASELLDRGIERMDALHEEPEIQASMMQVLGVVYEKMGLYEEAQPLLEKALTLRQEIYGESHVEVLRSLNDLAGLLRHKGDYDKAERLYRQALKMDRRLFGKEHVDVANSLNDLGSVLTNKGLYNEAELLHHEALEMRRKLLGGAHEDVAESLNDLGIALRKKGMLEEAEDIERKALAIERELHENDHPKIARSLNNLGVLLDNKGNYNEAEQLHREALTMRRKLLGNEHPEIAQSLNNLALTLEHKGNFDKAEQLHREALTMRRKLLGDEHPIVALDMDNLAIVLYRKGDYDEAERLSREALDLSRKILGHEHPDVVITMKNLATILKRTGNYDEAERMQREALALRRKLLGEDHPDVVIMLGNLASLLYSKRSYEEAQPVHREVLALREKLLGPEHPRVALAINNLGTVMYQLRAYNEADSLFRKAMGLWHKKYGSEHVDITYSLYWLGRVHHVKGDFDEAERLHKESLAMRRKLLGNKHSTLASSMHHLSEVLLDTNRPLEAEPMLREALNIREGAFGATAEKTVATKLLLGSCLITLGRYQEAEPLLLVTDRFYKEKPAAWHPEKEQARQALYDLYIAWGKPEQAVAYRDPTL